MEELDEILAKHFSGESNPDENALIAAWKNQHEEEYVALAAAWNTIDELPLDTKTVKTFDAKAAWTSVDNRLVEDKVVKVIKLNFYRNVAAACAILLVGLAGYWFINKDPHFESINNTANIPQLINLPDGSEVWLAANSTLDYQEDFAKNRSLKLKGEAFFEVAPDTNHPFIISTEMGDIEVLGTAFNVKSDEKSTLVSVDHGKVALRNNQSEVQLTAGESAISDAHGVSEKTAIAPNYNAWKTGVFNFKNTPLSQAIELLNAHYETKLILEVNFEDEPTLVGEFDNRPLEEIVEAICLTCHLEAEKGENVIRLK